MTGFLLFLHGRVVPYSRPIGFRDAASPAMGDSASPFDQRKAMTGQPIALLWVALTSRTLQCLDSGAAQSFRLVFFPFGVEFGHDRRPRDAGDIGKRMQRRVIGAACGPDVRTLRKCAAVGRGPPTFRPTGAGAASLLADDLPARDGCGWPAHASAARYRPGVTPVSRRNIDVRWLWSQSPTC